MPQGRVFGVIGGTATEPMLAYLDEPAPVTDEMMALAEPVQPTEVFRLAAPCVRVSAVISMVRIAGSSPESYSYFPW